MTMFYVSLCPVCFVEFGIPKRMEEVKRQNGGDFYCPNGHVLSWTDSENDKLRRERDRLRQQIVRLDEETTAAKKKIEQQSNTIFLMKCRSRGGVCPCCNRTFTNMARHMKTKHPDYNVVPLKGAS